MPKLRISREAHKKLCDELLEDHPDLVEALEEQKEFEHLYFAELAAIGPIKKLQGPIFYRSEDDDERTVGIPA